jgi:uncharacterized membrane protein (DUF485 family)
MAEDVPDTAGPAVPAGPTPLTVHTRRGLGLFAIYVVFYAGFMALAAFAPDAMERPTPFGSVNLAIMYGMGLILLALVLALVYVFISRIPDDRVH